MKNLASVKENMGLVSEVKPWGHSQHKWQASLLICFILPNKM